MGDCNFYRQNSNGRGGDTTQQSNTNNKNNKTFGIGRPLCGGLQPDAVLLMLCLLMLCLTCDDLKKEDPKRSLGKYKNIISAADPNSEMENRRQQLQEESKFQVTGFRFQVPGSRFQIPGFRLQVPDSRL